MKTRLRTTCWVSTLALLAACGQAQRSRVPAAPAHELPPNTDFIGRIWIATTPGSPRGSMLVFLPDRTLLMDSCFETYRISEWGVAGDRIRWREDTIPIEAEVTVPRPNQMVLRIAGRDDEQTFVAASAPYLCPDLPR